MNKVPSQTLTNMNNKTIKGSKMNKMLKIVALLSVMIGNFAIFQSSAHAYTTGYWKSSPSFGGGYTHKYYPSTGDILRQHGIW